MPPKVENIATLIAKREIAIASLDELYEEFNMLYQVEPELIALENVYKEIAIRFRSNLSMQGTSNVPGHWAETQASTLNIQQARNVPGQCPVQKVKIKDKDGNLVETLAM